MYVPSWLSVSEPTATNPDVTLLPLDGIAVKLYPVIALPLSFGAVKLTVALPFPAAADTPVGASGAAAGVTAPEAADSELVPTPFVAVTLNV